MTLANNLKPIMLFLLIAVAGLLRCQSASAAETETLTVAGGCFWCVEADFEKVPGVLGAVSGYTGGTVKDPSYKQVVKGGTGHYEAVQITFDPVAVSREKLLTLFLRSVDPTDAEGQFCDRGDSYRTAIFVSNPEENAVAKQVVAASQKALGQAIVTPVLPIEPFYLAEAYHQDYYTSTELVFTRFGPKRKAQAYKRYRMACGRDDRVRELWGDAAPFAGG